MTRYCGRCRQQKPITAFNKNQIYRCRLCQSEVFKAWWKKRKAA